MNQLRPEFFSDARLRYYAGEAVFNRGRSYYNQNRVTLDSLQPDKAHLHVQGNLEYCIDFFTEQEDFVGVCNCPHAESGNFCKHQVAAGIFLRDRLKGPYDADWKAPMDRVLQTLGNGQEQSRRGNPYYLLFVLRQQYSDFSLEPHILYVQDLPANGEGNTDPVLSEAALLDFIDHNPWVTMKARQPNRVLDPALCVNCDAGTVSLANIVNRTERMSSGYYYYNYSRPIEEYLALMAGASAPVFVGNDSKPFERAVRIWKESGEMQVSLGRDEAGGVTIETRFRIGSKEISTQRGSTFLISEDPVWILAGEDIFRLGDAWKPETAVSFINTPNIYIPPESETEFLEKYLVPLANMVPMMGAGLEYEEIAEQPIKRLYLSEENGELVARLRFAYQGYEVPFEKGMPAITTRHKQDGTWTLIRIRRDPQAEEGIYQSVSSPRSGLKRAVPPLDPDVFTLRARVDLVDFLLKRVPALLEDGFEIYGEDTLESARVTRAAPTLKLNVSSGIDWFDVQAVIRFGDIDVDLKEIRRALRRKKRYIKLADGTIGELPDEWVARYKHLFGLAEITDDGFRVSRHHITLIDELLEDVEQGDIDGEFQRQLEKLRHFSGIQGNQVPAEFSGELRPYQKAGFDWIHFLKDYRFGGILADDMGLGKTVQVLAFLQSVSENGSRGKANLVVVPRSLLVNWQREAQRFTPGLQVYEHFGPDRVKRTDKFSDYDIVLTTYGIMRRDIQMLRTYTFNHIVLDESQAIKNPVSQVSKASRLLIGNHRLALTGTPVENSTFELWSQFAFLNPGLLGGLEYFKREFGNPIERRQDQETADFLRSLVYPFILRRTKDQVAPELPPREEQVLYTDMEPAQRKFYERTRDYYRGLLLGMIQENGIDDSRIKILEGLLRLRQISNHPRLVEPEFRGRSAKLSLLMEQLETLQSEGHKVLIFSQFVQMLKLVRSELEARKMPYAYLDGQTRKRQERVDAFQSDPDIPFFLISLKAGGVGLNLTAADYVIHIDPWWNPAVEMQATDRTHRIGQDKPVFVYKLITRDSVEEKILTLQERKKALVDQLITTESSFFKKLSSSDVEVLFS